MERTTKKNPVIFTPEDIHTLFEIGENINQVCKSTEKCNAIVLTLFWALSAKLEAPCGLREDTMLSVVDAIYDYSSISNIHIENTYEKFHELYNEKRKICYGETE